MMPVILTSMYREGFEVVLFLQTIRLQGGTHAVLLGSAIGLGLTLIVAVLTFFAHQRQLILRQEPIRKGFIQPI
jgi:high-affinity Fe2+/Pb2+ permease